jgi:phosphoserine phosphatase
VAKLYLISISGENRTGITSALTSQLSQHHAHLLDIGQAVIHDALSLGVLVALPDDADTEGLFTSLRDEFSTSELLVRWQAIPREDYQHWVNQQGQQKHVVTLLGREISASALSQVTRELARNNLDIYHITRLTGRIGLDQLGKGSQSCIEVLLRGAVADAGKFRSDLLALASHLDIDLAYQVDDIFRRNRRMVVFDMDSTLIRQEVIDELAKEAGVGDEVSAITEAAMHGEMDFNQSLERRVALLAGLSENALEAVMSRIQLNEGAERLFRTLRHLGLKTAILSGGFTYFGERLKAQLKVDYLYANQLEIEDGKLTGRLVGEIINGDAKARLLRELAEREHLVPEQVIAVGDGANDLPMLRAAGLGVAFHAKPIVRESADQALSTLGLDAVLYLLGLSDADAQ